MVGSVWALVRPDRHCVVLHGEYQHGFALLHKLDKDPLVERIEGANAQCGCNIPLPDVIHDDPYMLDYVYIMKRHRRNGYAPLLLRHIGKERQVTGETGEDWTYSLYYNASYNIDNGEALGRSVEWQERVDQST